jgi:hypothetical protein
MTRFQSIDLAKNRGNHDRADLRGSQDGSRLPSVTVIVGPRNLSIRAVPVGYSRTLGARLISYVVTWRSAGAGHVGPARPLSSLTSTAQKAAVNEMSLIDADDA